MKTAPLLRDSHDWRTLGLLALETFLLILAWLFRWYFLIPVLAVLAITACCAKHNHTHCPTFRSGILNRFMDYWLMLLTGSSTTGIRVAHQVRHHGQNQSAQDFVRYSQVAHMPPGKALLCFVPFVVQASVRHTTADFQSAKRSKLRARLWHERILLWVLLLMLAWHDIAAFCPLVMAPLLFGQWFLIAINLPQHDGLETQSAWNHSRNVVGPWSNWIFLNNGFHTAHHQRPGLHWSRLSAWHAQYVNGQIRTNLDHPSLLKFWQHWWRQRKLANSH